MSVALGPDFLCIGMQKAGTGWAFDQLQYHPDFWMPPIKEIHYLDRETPKLGNARKVLARVKKTRKKNKPAPAHRRAWDDRDVEFLEQAIALAGKPLDLDEYASMFRFKGDKITGDVTPNYSGLKEETIKGVAKKFPGIKVFLLVRDPVARLWSQVCMADRREKFDRTLLQDLVKFREFLEYYTPFQKVGFPARIAERWEKNAPGIGFKYFFFDDIVAKPDDVRAELIAYLGGDPAKSSGEIEADHNRKATAQKLELTDDVRAVIADFFKDEIKASAARFGGHASGWLTRYGIA
ncbi:MAG TPA: sulfotransferase [Rhizomicrobium sp.]|nr:sulfotransferase [Rhizomicrobium sp.]